ncbi:MAG: hypothetical protein M1833_005618 [Piccolia ochrophora]|nr:MAG: hypothetical protein M1833_005618 [Piccolia ochrophora]
MAMNAMGGPVGGMPMMNNGLMGGPRNSNQNDQSRTILNTYVYDYLLKNKLYDCARAFIGSDAIVVNAASKPSPSRRRDGDGNLLNGIDENSMDADIKEDVDSKRPDDLPHPKIPDDSYQNSFLQDWWCIFWDMYNANQRFNDKNKRPGEGGAAMQYIGHTQHQQRMRQEQQAQLLRSMNPQMMHGQQYQSMMRMNGMNGMNMAQNELQRKALQNQRNAYVQPTPQQLAMAKNQQMMHQQMQRQNSNLDINGGPRPESPASADNAPSPAKRQRLENGGFGGQAMGPNGRVPAQGVPGQPVGTAANTSQANSAQQMLQQHGIDPTTLSASQFNSFQQQNPNVQQKSIQVYAQNLAQHQRSALNNQTVPKGMNPGAVPNQASPMMQQVEGQDFGNMREFYAGNGAAQMRQGGNHALQDYQMQLMLLEQQNKKRLMMARQEQDGHGRPDQPVPGQPGFQQGMSPSGSRSGPSPNPQDQMKRGTPPKMVQSGMPGSPLPDGSMPQQRGSPAGMGFPPGMQPQMGPQFLQELNDMNKNMVGGAPNGALMRPPSSHPGGFNGPMNQQQVEMARQQAAGRMPGENWQQPQQGPGQVAQQPPQGQRPQQIGTPQQRAMPPPQAPPANASNNNGNGSGRTQPSSPQQNPAPPTPQQSNKPNPKGKKEGKETTRKRPTKKNSTAASTTGATPSSEAEPPPTPTPSTPITPVHPQSFNGGKGGNAPSQASAANSQPQAAAPAAAQPSAPPQPDPNQMAANFGGMDGMEDQHYNLNFAGLESGDVLESFDFDSFLNTDDPNMQFDMSNLSGFNGVDGVEAGSGDV